MADIKTAREALMFLQRQVIRIEEAINERERAATPDDHCHAATKLYRSTTDAEAEIEHIREAIA